MPISVHPGQALPPPPPAACPTTDTNLSWVIASHIRHLVTHLNKKNFKATATELRSLTALYGSEAYVYLLRCLVEVIFKDTKSQKDVFKTQLLAQEVAALIEKPMFTTLVYQAFDGLDISHHSLNNQDDLVGRFVKLLKLPAQQELLLYLHLLESLDPLFRQAGLKGLKSKLSDIPKILGNLSTSSLLHLVRSLKQHESEIASSTSETDLIASIKQSISQLITSNGSSLNPLQFILDIESPPERQTSASPSDALFSRLLGSTSVAAVMRDFGYCSCASPATLSALLSHFSPINDNCVAQIVHMMGSTLDGGLDDMPDAHATFASCFPLEGDLQPEEAPTCWDVDVLLAVIQEKAPNTNWMNVLKCLDQPCTAPPTHAYVQLVHDIFQKATGQAALPVAFLYDKWRNTLTHLHLVRLVAEMPGELFDFRAPSLPGGGRDESDLPPSIPQPHPAWRSLPFIDTLLRLAETGTSNYAVARAAFNAPLKQSPEALLLALARVDAVGWTPLYAEICFSMLMPIFLSNQPNSSFVLHRLLATNRRVLMRGLAEKFYKDRSSLSQLLEVVQELKALVPILDEARPHAFVIHLAALASHREFLNLEIWLNHRIEESDPQFIADCVSFLREKASQLRMEGAAPLPRLSQPVINTFFTVLHANAKLLRPELSEEVARLRTTFADAEKMEEATHTHALAPSGSNALGLAAGAAPPFLSTPSAPIAMPGGHLRLPGQPVPVPFEGDPQSQQQMQAGVDVMYGFGNEDGRAAGAAAPSTSPGIAGSPSELDPLEKRTFPPEVEEAANSYFKQIYRGELSIDKAIALLKSLKHGTAEQQQVFVCMIHYLFDEYRHFPKFPEAELKITAVLFGSLIQHQLVTYLPLGMALRYILDALKNPPTSKMFKFGILALEQFKSRLSSWPQYCNIIVSIEALRQYHPDIVQYILDKHMLQAPVVLPPPAVTGASPVSVALAIPAQTTKSDEKEMDPGATHLATLLSAHKMVSMLAPDEALQDKIHFIFNNLSQMNITDKVAEFIGLLPANSDRALKYYPWVAHYLVVRRVSLESNFHALYLSFLDKLDFADLLSHILQSTYENIRVLLKSEKIKSDMHERNVLKNLGSWLGNLTVARNKPILHRLLPLKDVLIEGFDHGYLIAVVPFVCKVMESCKSRVFKPKNVWVAAILSVLAEIYALPNIKLNMKFEIELLCRNLSLELSALAPATILADRPSPPPPAQWVHSTVPPLPVLAPQSLTAPISLAAGAASVLQASLTAPALGPTTTTTLSSADAASAATATQAAAAAAAAASVRSVLPADVTALALNRAVQEIISPVVERSTSIATLTTRELIVKDFAMETEDSRIRTAALLMAQNLAGNLALVTCKEPLRVSLDNHLRSLLPATTPLPEGLDVLYADSLELAYTGIEKTAREKAAREIDRMLAQLFGRKAAGAPLAPYTQVPACVPDFLLARSTPGSPPDHIRVYDDFEIGGKARVSQSTAQPAPSSSPPLYPHGAPSQMPTGLPQPEKEALETGLEETRRSESANIEQAAAPGIKCSISDSELHTALTSNAPQSVSVPPSPSKAGLAMKKPPVAGIRDQVALLFEEWVSIVHDEAKPNDKAVVAYLNKLQQQEVFKKGEEVMKKFFGLCTDICVESFETCRANNNMAGAYRATDALGDLVVMLVRMLFPETQEPQGAGSSTPSPKITFLTTVFGAVVHFLMSDYESKQAKFDQRPYYRLLANWLSDLSALLSTTVHQNHLQLIFCNTFRMLSPLRLPAFCFAWLKLVFHRMFMPRLLMSEGRKGWPLYERLIVELLKYLEPYLKAVKMTDAVRAVYCGTLKGMLVVLHDFPEFLSEYHFSFCDVLPPTCIQLRNIILSAYPRSMRLPDPFTPNLKVDCLPEINQPPHMQSDYVSNLTKLNLRADIDAFLQHRNQALLRTIRSKLHYSQQEALLYGCKYSTAAVNALVLYVGVQAIAMSQAKAAAKGGPASPIIIIDSAPMDIFRHFAVHLDPEGRYLFLNGIINQLRFPNTHTHYFSCVLLYLFAEAKQEIIQEQITRVLLERLIVSRPHPWGLMITFLEIIKNPRYRFWNYAFTRSDPEMKRLFENVSSTCIHAKARPDDPGMASSFSTSGVPVGSE